MSIKAGVGLPRCSGAAPPPRSHAATSRFAPAGCAPAARSCGTTRTITPISASRQAITSVSSGLKGKWHSYLPYIFMVLAALSRWPGLFPPNFSAFYGLAFCAGAFFSRPMKWQLPLGALLLTDVALDFYYHSFSPTQLVNYVAFGAIIWFGSIARSTSCRTCRSEA